MRFLFLVALLFFKKEYAVAQIMNSMQSPAYATVTAPGSTATMAPDISLNAALPASFKNPSIVLCSERKYLLKELTHYNLTGILPTRLGKLGFQLNYAGFSNYRQTQISVAYARKLTDIVDAGLQFSYYGNRIPGYVSVSGVSSSVGIMLHFSEKLVWGLAVQNLVAVTMGKKAAQKPARSYTGALGYAAGEHFYLSLGAFKEEGNPLVVNAGMEYTFGRQFFFRAGLQTGSPGPFAGAGWQWGKFRTDIFVSYHQRLGFSPGILLAYSPSSGVQ